MNRRLRSNLFNVLIMTISVSLYGCNSNSSTDTQSAVTPEIDQSAMTGETDEEALLFGDLSAKEIDVQTMTLMQGSSAGYGMPAQVFKIGDTATTDAKAGETATINIAYDAKLGYLNGVSFSLNLIEKPNLTSEADSDAEPRLWHIDSASVETVATGPGTLEVETFLPYDIPTGDYVLLGQIVEEAKIDPETYDIDKDLGVAMLPLRITQPSAPPIGVAEIDFAADYMGMSASPEVDQDGFATEANIQASVEISNGGVEPREVEVKATWETSGGAGDLSLSGGPEGAISTVIKVTIPPTTEDPFLLPINAFLSKSDHATLLGAAPNLEDDTDATIPELTLTVSISDPAQTDAADKTASSKLGFLIESPVNLFDEEETAARGAGVLAARDDNSRLQKTLKRLVSGKRVGPNWKKRWGKKKRIAFEPSFSYGVGVKHDPFPWASAVGKSGINLYVIGKKVTLIELAGSGVVSSLPVRGVGEEIGTSSRFYGGGVTFELFGIKLIDEIDRPTESDVVARLGATSAEVKLDAYKKAVSVIQTGVSVGKTWDTDKVIVTVRFPVGPVPISIKGGVAGSIGVHGMFEVSGLSLSARAAVPATLEAYIEGGIDFIAVQAGVKGTVELVSIGAIAGGRIGLDAWIDEGSNDLSVGVGLQTVAFVGDATVNDIDIFDKATREANKASILKGLFGLFARVKGLKICWTKKRFFLPRFPYPCGFKTYEYNKTLFESDWLLQRHVPLMNWGPRFKLITIDEDNKVHSAI